MWWFVNLFWYSCSQYFISDLIYFGVVVPNTSSDLVFYSTVMFSRIFIIFSLLFSFLDSTTCLLLVLLHFVELAIPFCSNIGCYLYDYLISSQ